MTDIDDFTCTVLVAVAEWRAELFPLHGLLMMLSNMGYIDVSR